MNRKTLAPEKLTEEAAKAINSYHSQVVDEVSAAVDANRIVVVGMGLNPFVKKAKALLDEKKMTYKSLNYGNYTSQWKERLAIKIWSGWPTYPQVFVDGKLVGGFKELKKAMDDGKIK